MLGGAICLLASAVTISLFDRAKASQGRARVIWIGLDAAVGGCGIWATHFVAMLAYDPGTSAGYNFPVTLLSLVFAVTISAVGLSIALADGRRSTVALGGAVVGVGVAAMHYTGMMALQLPARIVWSPGIVVGLRRVRKRVRSTGAGRCRAPASSLRHTVGGHRAADGRDRLASLHGDGGRHARSGSDPRRRRDIDIRRPDSRF